MKNDLKFHWNLHENLENLENLKIVGICRETLLGFFGESQRDIAIFFSLFSPGYEKKKKKRWNFNDSRMIKKIYADK